MFYLDPGVFALVSFLPVLAALFYLVRDNRRRGLAPLTLADAEDGRWSLGRLLLASFLTLFVELAMIRWMAVEIRLFAYFKNLMLLLCFVGFGIGCALARRRPAWSLSSACLFGLICMLAFPYGLQERNRFLAMISPRLGNATDINIWGAHNPELGGVLITLPVVFAILLAVVCVFLPLGQMTSRQMDLAPRLLKSYSWNLAASLVGILAFFGVCYLMLPPAAWLAVAFVGFALLQPRMAPRLLLASLMIPASAMLYHGGPSPVIVWSPYQQVEYTAHMRQGELYYAGLRVNHTGHQSIINLSPEFHQRHPGIDRVPLQDHPYNLPFRFAVPNPKVLIVGSGMGNDVAGAVRNHAAAVDAVEIDRAIWQLGVDNHPERPYQSPVVRTHINDARAFLRRSSERYDLVLFGLLDSHTNASDYSNMRIDNFVYTEESFREAKARLTPDGVLFLKFEVARPWLGRRIFQMLTQTFGKEPVAFHGDTGYGAPATCFAISTSDRVQQALAADAALAELVRTHPPTRIGGGNVALTTDDWPYLYNQGRWIPSTYYSGSVLVLLVALVMYLQVPGTSRRVPSLFFFTMGAGFMLLETQVISRLALYFGSTWQVSGIVIASVLITLVISTLAADRYAFSPRASGLLLLASILTLYFVPFEKIPGQSAAVGTLMAVAFGVPIFLAGQLFAAGFKRAAVPSAALGANMLGAVVGGLVENVSLIIGLNALLLVTFGFYAVALWAFQREGRSYAGEAPVMARAAAAGS